MILRSTLLWLVLGMCLSFHLQSQVIINEISYNPPEAGNDSLEYIELYNSGAAPVNLDSWYFTKGIIDTLPNIMINAGGYFVTAIKSQAMANVFGIIVHQWHAGALSNSGETIALADAGGNLIDSVAYKHVDPWPKEANGMGPSLELKDPGLDNNDGANWQISGGATGVIINGFEVMGTPGAKNSGGGTGGPAVTINAANKSFTPKNAVVPTGSLVRWVNNESIPHNVDAQQSIYPGNPASFYSGDPAIGPWQYDYLTSETGLFHYRCDVHFSDGMVGTLSVYDPLAYTDFPLTQLRLTDGINGRHLFVGVPTRVTGVVHGINFLPTGYSFFIINDQNVGINVFAASPGSYTVTEGDLIQVSGVIDQFNGLLEIVPDQIDVMDTGRPLVMPLLTTQVTEDLESSHIEVGPYTIDSLVATGTSGYNLYVTHQFGAKVLIRVDSDLGLDSATIVQANEVRGIGTQFDPSFPYTSGYQVQALQFYSVNGLPLLASNAITMNPNPAADQIHFSSDIQINQIDLYSLDGRNMMSRKLNSTGETISVASIPNGLYILRAITKQGIWTSKLVVER